MWYVEPPDEVELDEPIMWFNERHQAFEFVDDQIREQPVRASVVDEIPQRQFTTADLTVLRHEDNPLLPRYVPKAERQPEQQREPLRVNSDAAGDRVSDYASRVGLG
jgi:hypothetical protein